MRLLREHDATRGLGCVGRADRLQCRLEGEGARAGLHRRQFPVEESIDVVFEHERAAGDGDHEDHDSGHQTHPPVERQERLAQDPLPCRLGTRGDHGDYVFVTSGAVPGTPSGMMSEIRVPLPSSLSISVRPPWNVTIPLTMARPRPTLPNRDDRERSAR